MEKKTEYNIIEVKEMKKPPSIITERNEPNFELMAKAFKRLYYKSIKSEAQKSLKQ